MTDALRTGPSALLALGLLLGVSLAPLSAGSALAQGSPATARAHPSAAWVIACEAALDRRIRRERASVARIALTPATLEDWPITLSDTGVRGDGSATAPKGIVPFSFTCIYSDRMRAVTQLRYRMGKTDA